MVNKVILVGHVGADPEGRNAQTTGVRICNFRMATEESWKDRNGDIQKRVEWHRIVAWDKIADVVERLLAKGSKVYVEGKIQTRKFEGRDGIMRHVTEIVAKEIRLVGQKDNDTGDDAGDERPNNEEDTF